MANLAEFFGRFHDLNVHGDAELDELVARAQAAVRGVAPQALRDDETLRRRVRGQMASVRSALDALLTDRPRRNILRPARPQNGEQRKQEATHGAGD